MGISFYNDNDDNSDDNSDDDDDDDDDDVCNRAKTRTCGVSLQYVTPKHYHLRSLLVA